MGIKQKTVSNSFVSTIMTSMIKSIQSLAFLLFLLLPFLHYGQSWEGFKKEIKVTEFKYDDDYILFDSLIKRYESEYDSLVKIDILFSIEEYTYQTYSKLEIAIDSLIIDYCNKNIDLFDHPNEQDYFKKRKAKACGYLASNYVYFGEYAKAKILFDESFELNEYLENKGSLANLHNNYAMMLEATGNYIEANNHYVKSLELRNEINEESKFTIITLTNLGLNYHELGNEQKAIVQYDLALQLAEKLELLENEASIMNSIGLSYATIKEYNKAKKYFLNALNLSVKKENKRVQAEVFINLGNLYEDLDSTEKALDYYYESFEAIQGLSDPGLKADISNNLGIIHMNIGHFDLSKKYYDQAYKNYDIANDNLGLAGVLSNQSELAYLNHDLKKAVSLNSEAIDLLDESQYVDFLWSVYERQCGYLAEMGMYKEALSMNQKYDSIYKKIHSLENQKSLIGYDLKLEYEKANYKKELDHGYEIEKAKLELENERSRTQFWFVVVIAIFALSTLLFLLIRYRTNKRITAEKLVASEKLTEAIILSQEEERKRISQELHDGIGAELITAKFKLISDTSNEAYTIIESAITDIRNLSHQLIPPAIDKQSIEQSLERYLNSVKSDLPFVINSSYLGDLTVLTSAQKISIYRITQECLSNTIKYAKAKEVTIQLTLDNNEFSMIYEDDGIGFDQSITPSGIGLANMKARIKELGGTLEISSSSEYGTSILITITT